MTAHGWLTVLSSVGQVFLGLLALRGGRSVLALPLSLLCFDFFVFNVADLAYQLDGNFTWKLIDHIASPLAAPLTLQIMATFTGRARALRTVLYAAYAGMGLLSATGVGAFVSPALADFQLAHGWGIWHFSGDVGATFIAAALLIRHYSVETDPAVRQRTRLILAAAAVTLPLCLTDILADVSIRGAPHLSNIGTLAATSLLAVSVLRFRLFGTDLSASAVTTAAVLALGVLAAYAVLFELLVSHTAVLVLGTASAAVLVALLARTAGAALRARRARATQLATLGRFAAQLAHDLKNPLAAVKGATEFLLEEVRQGRSLDPQAKFLSLAHDQVRRIEESLRGFERLGRVELLRTQISIDDLVADALSLLAQRPPAGVEVRVELDGGLPEIAADGEMLTRALDNVVSNALEAMPGPGTLTVRTSRGSHPRLGIAISVADTGEGMDAATCERALDDFFTTKANGSGLGLPFARRVVEAHGGELVLTSRKGRGTRVDLFLPTARG